MIMTKEQKIDLIEQTQSLIEEAISNLETVDDEEVNDNIIPTLEAILDNHGRETVDLSLEEVRKRLYAN